MKKKINKNYVNYDVEKTFTNDLFDIDEIKIDELLKQGKIQSIYAIKTIKSGKITEIEIYPEFSRSSLRKHKEVKRKNNQHQNNLNDKNSKKKLQRLINCNFSKNDIWATLTYDNEHLPKTMNEALKNMQNYIRKLNRIRKKAGKPNAKYIYITEHSSTRCHHHLIISGDMSLDDIEFNWTKGRRNNTRRIEENEDGLDALALYMTKEERQEKNKKRWNQSKNLEKPKVRKDHKITMKQIRKMIENSDEIMKFVKKKYRHIEHKYSQSRFNEINKMMYFYARCIQKE
ncbi:hypothetical protein B7939_00620 [Eggerthia catenaformis]|nr:hypothetical protein B7939_00620 [Eggerthia catenaformis]